MLLLVMVALYSSQDEPTRRPQPARRPLLLWRVLMRVDRALVNATGKLVVTGGIPAELRERPLLLAANHIGNLDPFVLVAACDKIGFAPNVMSTGGLFDIPVVGKVWRRCGHVRADRGKKTVTAALDSGIAALLDGKSLLIYPEGRISRTPGLWPERGKTGAARMALSAGTVVIPISQWGAHEAMVWGSLTVENWGDFLRLVRSWGRAVLRRPTMKVHFGEPVELGDLSATRIGDAARARDRIMRRIATGLVPLRITEPDEPSFQDPTRPTDSRSPWTPDQL